MTYLAVYRPDVNDSIAARCNAYAARIALGRTDGLADKIITEWSAPKSLPPVCDPAFDWLKSQGLLTATLIERRARAALDAGQAGLARYLARSLPATTAAPIEQWAGLIEQPRASIDALIANPSRTVDPKALLDGWRRYARADVDATVIRYPELVQARGLDASAASPFAIAVGLWLALKPRSACARLLRARPGERLRRAGRRMACASGAVGRRLGACPQGDRRDARVASQTESLEVLVGAGRGTSR